jgi:hypothetical protein
MEYNKIVSVSGLSGLFELVSSRQDGAVVRSLEDNSSKFVSSRIHHFSHLESIEIYTVRENVYLSDVFKAMQASGEARPEEKADGKVLKAYFEKVYPDMDFARVYASDMKKMVKWLAVLEKHNVAIASPTGNTEEAAAAEADPSAEPVAEKKKAAKGKEGGTKTKDGAAKAKDSGAKATTKSAPAKKVTAPRKMA